MNTQIDIIESFIKAKMIIHHKGKDNAIKRRELIEYIRNYVDPDISFRLMSVAYENLPICGGNEGLYIPNTEAEREAQIERYKSWIKAMALKIRILKKLNIPPQPIQPELFQ